MKNLRTKERLDMIIESIKYVYDYFIKANKFAFKLVSLSRFYERLHNVLYNKDYEYKFFLQISQFKKFNEKRK